MCEKSGWWEAGNLGVPLPYPSLSLLNTRAELGMGGRRLVRGPQPQVGMDACWGPGAGRPSSTCPGGVGQGRSTEHFQSGVEAAGGGLTSRWGVGAGAGCWAGATDRGGQEVGEGFTQHSLISLNIFPGRNKCGPPFFYISAALSKYICSNTGTSDLPPCSFKVFVYLSYLPYWTIMGLYTHFPV